MLFSKNACFYPGVRGGGGVGGGALEGSLIRSFRVFVTQSPTRQFSLSSRNGPPVLGEDINTIEALQALSVIKVKFLLVILLLYKTEWS